MKHAGLAFLSLCSLNAFGSAMNFNLGSADGFAVLGGSTITSTGPTDITGNVGVWPGTAITGFPTGTISGGTFYAGDAVAKQAEADLLTAYNVAAGETCGSDLSGENLGGITLTPGVYCFTSSAQLTGKLTLDAQSDPNAIFLFQIVSTLNTADESSVVFTGNGQGGSVFWQVGSSATLGTNTSFAGNILAMDSVTLTTGASINCGRALASTGAVTMDSNLISIDTPGCASTASAGAPEGGTSGLVSLGLLAVIMLAQRFRIGEKCVGLDK